MGQWLFVMRHLASCSWGPENQLDAAQSDKPAIRGDDGAPIHHPAIEGPPGIYYKEPDFRRARDQTELFVKAIPIILAFPRPGVKRPSLQQIFDMHSSGRDGRYVVACFHVLYPSSCYNPRTVFATSANEAGRSKFACATNNYRRACLGIHLHRRHYRVDSKVFTFHWLQCLCRLTFRQFCLPPFPPRSSDVASGEKEWGTLP